jgi:hypothetical protein
MSDVPHPGEYERSDADPRLIGALALGIVVFLIATPFLLHAGYSNAVNIGGGPPNLPKPPPPRLQVEPKADLERLHSYERGKLQTFGWVDRDRQIARIPIDRAMQLLAERGLPGWPSAKASPENPNPR